MTGLQAGCSAEAQALAAEVAARQAELAEARVELECCQTRQGTVARDIAETERRLQARSPAWLFCRPCLHCNCDNAITITKTMIII